MQYEIVWTYTMGAEVLGIYDSLQEATHALATEWAYISEGEFQINKVH